MGLRFVLAQVTSRDSDSIDWDAGFKLIETIELRALSAETLEWHWEENDYLDGADEFPPNPYGTYQVTRHMRDLLWGDLEDLRAVLEQAAPAMTAVPIPGHHVYVTGGLAGVDGGPGSLYGAIYRLADAGALAAAGFADASRTTADDPATRRDPFTLQQRRWSAAGRALLYAIDDAARMAPDAPNIKAKSHAESWKLLLERFQEVQRHASGADQAWRRRTQRSLLSEVKAGSKFAAKLLALGEAAAHWGGSLQPESPYSDSNTLVERLDGFAEDAARYLADCESDARGRAPSKWLPNIQSWLEDISYALDLNSGPLDAEERLAAETFWGQGPLDQIRVLLAGLLGDCCLALASLYPFGLGPQRVAVRDYPPNIVPRRDFPDRPSGGKATEVSCRDGASWFTAFFIAAGTRLRWRTTERVARDAGLERDFRYLREVFRHDYFKWGDYADVPGGRLWAFHGEDHYDEEPANRFRWEDLTARLRDAGVLDALGARPVGARSDRPRSQVAEGSAGVNRNRANPC